MNYHFRKSIYERYFLIVSDTIGIPLCFLAARFVRLGEKDLFLLERWDLIGPLAIIFFVFYLFDLYEANSDFSNLSNYARTLTAVFLLIPLISLYIISLPPIDRNFYGRGVLVFFFIFFCIWSFLSRFFAYKCFEWRRKKSKWLIIGRPSKGDGPLESKESNISFSFVEGEDKDILERLDSKKWAGLIICDGIQLEKETIEKIMAYRFSGKFVCRFNDFYESLWFKIPIFSLTHKWFIFSSGLSLLHKGWIIKFKRASDIFLSLSFLAVSLPLGFLIALLIKLESKGPIFYQQVRTGLNGLPFNIYKFRSMGIGAESSGAVWTQKRDKRATKIGKILRLTHLDELPQLINIIKGEMSFIGPRPERPEMIEVLEKEIPFYNTRHIVRPGLTGWAQVLYPYGSSVHDAKEKLRYDLYYIKNFSFYLDLAILIKTVRAVFFGRGR